MTGEVVAIYVLRTDILLRVGKIIYANDQKNTGTNTEHT